MSKESGSMERQGRPPVLIMSCIRSGSTLLASILQRLGVFMGAEMGRLQAGQETLEPVFLSNIDLWLAQIGTVTSKWFRHPARRKLVEDYIRLLLSSPNAASYLGEELYKTYGSLFNLDIPWGWKNPSLVLTLPVWRSIFPEAKVIYIHRNGVAVARSILNMDPDPEGRFRTWLEGQEKKSRTGCVDFPPPESTFSLNSSSEIETALRLWETDTRVADILLTSLPDSLKMTVRYEALISDTRSVLAEICRFLGLTDRSVSIEEICATIKPELADAYKNDPAYQRVYEAYKSSPQMVKYSYC